MGIYAVNIILIGLYAGLAKAYENPIKGVQSRSYKWFYAIASIQLLLILALRSTSVGVDMKGYVRRFNYVNSVDLKTAFEYVANEKGYTVLTRLIGRLTMDENWFKAIMACICLLPCLVTIKRESPMPFFSLLIYITMQYYTFIFSGLRQGTAYALTFWSYKFIRERKILPYAILVTIACFMHKSAVFFIPAYFLSRIKINKVSLSVFAVIAVAFFVLKNQLAQYIIDWIYSKYEVADQAMSGSWNLMCIVMVVALLPFRQQLVDRGVQCNALYIFLMVGAILQLSTMVVSNGGRIAIYYFMYITILLPQAFKSLKDSKIFVFGTYVMIGWFICIYFMVLASGAYHVVPYKFFWQW